MEKKNPERARGHKGEIPIRKDRNVVIKAHNRLLHHRSKLQMRESILGDRYSPSVLPIKDLRKLYLEDLVLESHHRGSYVLLRAVTTAIRMASIQTVMEDEKNEVVKVSLYQQDEEVDRTAVDILPVNTVLIIKEPYLNILGDADYALRVDHVSDLIWFSENDEKVPLEWRSGTYDQEKSADNWKQEGNDAMNAKNYHGAVHKQVLPIIIHHTLLIIVKVQLSSVVLAHYSGN